MNTLQLLVEIKVMQLVEYIEATYRIYGWNLALLGLEAGGRKKNMIWEDANDYEPCEPCRLKWPLSACNLFSTPRPLFSKKKSALSSLSTIGLQTTNSLETRAPASSLNCKG